MSTDVVRSDLPENTVGDPLTMREVTILLVKHYGLHQGHYDLLVEFQIGTGMVGQNAQSVCPGAIVGVAKMGLAKSEGSGPLSVNAAEVNPADLRSKRSRQT